MQLPSIAYNFGVSVCWQSVMSWEPNGRPHLFTCTLNLTRLHQSESTYVNYREFRPYLFSRTCLLLKIYIQHLHLISCTSNSINFLKRRKKCILLFKYYTYILWYSYNSRSLIKLIIILFNRESGKKLRILWELSLSASQRNKLQQ